MTATEIVSAYSFEVRDFSYEYLHEANLHEANLSGANLSRANLHEANLSGANLSRANLHEANLSRANLHEANLSGANLSGANLRWADLRGANLRGANLRWADLRGANLHEANLRGANLRGANLHEANLHEANLSGADLRGAEFPSPTMFLLANWGEVSDWLCRALMRYDASNHDDSMKFAEWKNNGDCPYSGKMYERSASFVEKRNLFSMDAPLLSARQLMQCLLFEKTVYYMTAEDRDSYSAT